jgi:hypothetical protein
MFDFPACLWIGAESAFEAGSSLPDRQTPGQIPPALGARRGDMAWLGQDNEPQGRTKRKAAGIGEPLRLNLT